MGKGELREGLNRLIGGWARYGGRSAPEAEIGSAAPAAAREPSRVGGRAGTGEASVSRTMIGARKEASVGRPMISVRQARP